MNFISIEIQMSFTWNSRELNRSRYISSKVHKKLAALISYEFRFELPQKLAEFFKNLHEFMRN